MFKVKNANKNSSLRFKQFFGFISGCNIKLRIWLNTFNIRNYIKNTVTPTMLQSIHFKTILFQKYLFTK